MAGHVTNEKDLERCMRLAIEEAHVSLREGNHGFGAVIALDGRALAQCHDTEESDSDPTAHAELKAIRLACSRVGKELSRCVIVSTHEPCPMCAAAIVWSGLPVVAYGYGIADSIRQGRTRIDLECGEIFRRAGADIEVRPGLLKEDCAVLYNKEVRAEIRKLRGASDDRLRAFDAESMRKRIAWYQGADLAGARGSHDSLETAYRVLLLKLGIGEQQAPIRQRTEAEIRFHSRNWCPTLEACRILGLETARVCRLSNETSTDALIKMVDPRLTFTRNYERMRPGHDYCEEIIRMEPDLKAPGT